MFIFVRTAVLIICIHLHIPEISPVFLSSISFRRQQRIYFFLPVSFATKEVRMHVKFRFTTRCFPEADEVIWQSGVQPQMRL